MLLPHILVHFITHDAHYTYDAP